MMYKVPGLIIKLVFGVDVIVWESLYLSKIYIKKSVRESTIPNDGERFFDSFSQNVPPEHKPVPPEVFKSMINAEPHGYREQYYQEHTKSWRLIFARVIYERNRLN